MDLQSSSLEDLRTTVVPQRGPGVTGPDAPPPSKLASRASGTRTRCPPSGPDAPNLTHCQVCQAVLK